MIKSSGFILVAMALVVATFSAHAQLPSGGVVVNGRANITGNAGLLRINQASQNAIINWQGFSIGANKQVRFTMPNGGSVLNRVTGVDPSIILGSLQASGNVMLINPNGIHIGRSGRVNVGGFVASTLDVSDSQFLKGGTLDFAGDSSSSVQNFGEINSLGDVFLIGRNVSNSGTIRGTHAGLAAGQSVELHQLDPENPGLERLTVHASAGSTRSTIGVDNKPDGIIEATTAELKAAGGNIYALAVNNGGTVRATSIVKKQGRIFLKARGGTVIHSGTLDVSAKTAKAKGGEVQVLGKNVGLAANSKIDASGEGGGGQVLVGGDYQGKNENIHNAETTVMKAGASIRADALEHGDGGRVILWADDTTLFEGDISARGGAKGGDGGFVETSGKDTLLALGAVDVAAPAGQGGQWLLDPRNITISSGATSNIAETDLTPSPATETYTWDAATAISWEEFKTTKNFLQNADDSIVNASTIINTLNAGGSVKITTNITTPNGVDNDGGDITINAPITKTSHGSKDTAIPSVLALEAGRDIIINKPISATSSATTPLSLHLGAYRGVNINASLTGLKRIEIRRFAEVSSGQNFLQGNNFNAYGITGIGSWVRQVDIGTKTSSSTGVNLSADYIGWSSKLNFVNEGSAGTITPKSELRMAGDIILSRDLIITSPKVRLGKGDIFKNAFPNFEPVIDDLPAEAAAKLNAVSSWETEMTVWQSSPFIQDVSSFSYSNSKVLIGLATYYGEYGFTESDQTYSEMVHSISPWIQYLKIVVPGNAESLFHVPNSYSTAIVEPFAGPPPKFQPPSIGGPVITLKTVDANYPGFSRVSLNSFGYGSVDASGKYRLKVVDPSVALRVSALLNSIEQKALNLGYSTAVAEEMATQVRTAILQVSRNMTFPSRIITPKNTFSLIPTRRNEISPIRLPQNPVNPEGSTPDK